MSDFRELIDWCGQTNTRQLLIRQRGETLVEECWDADPSTTTDIASMQKCLSTVVLGQLVAEGVMDLAAPVAEYLGVGWTKATPEQESQITVRDVVTMRSGLNDVFEYDSPAGSDWYYCNNAYHQVRRAMEVVTGLDSEALFAQRLWRPLEMASTSWKARPEMVDPTGWVLSGVHTTARDQATFGEAVMRRDERLGCTSEFLDEMTSGTETNPSYGLMYWIYGGPWAVVPGHRKDQEFDPKKVFGGVKLNRRIAPSAPLDCYGGNGAGDQRLLIVPSQGLIIVRIGRAAADMNAAGGPYDEAFWSHMPAEYQSQEQG